MKFRGDIEGLRGVAVLLVLLSHAGVPGWFGGFVGVDVFFVVSGYLISGLLVRELEEHGHIQYWEFFARRVRRLAPALLTMLAIVAVATAVLLPNAQWEAQAAAGKWAALWSSNLYFAFGRVEYFGESARDNVFLHTWSLGVEEQFYLVWPFLICMLWRRLPRVRVWAIASIAAASLILFLYLAQHSAIAAYYLMPTRLWQLACGALTFLLSARVRNCPPGPANGLAAGGMALLAATVVAIGSETPYPGLVALGPALAAALMLFAGGRDSFATSFLSLGLLRWFGRISYSLYLWHWPILVIGYALAAERQSGFLSAGLVVASVMAGAASEAWVERPTRYRQVAGTAKTTVVLAVVASAVLAALGGVWQAMGIAVPAVDGAATPADRVRAMVSLPAIYAVASCDDYYQSDRLVPCGPPSPASSAATVAMIGDSIGMQWYPAIAEWARRRNWRLVAITKSSCPMVDEPIVNARIMRRFTECEKWRDRVVKYVRELKPDLIVMGSSPSYDLSREQWVKGGRRFVRSLEPGRRDIVVLAGTPVLPFNGVACAMDNAVEVAGRIEVDGCSVPLAQVRLDDVASRLRDSLEGLDRTHLLVLDDLACPNGICRALGPQGLEYRDNRHLNADFVSSLATDFGQRLDQVLEHSAGISSREHDRATPSTSSD